MNESRLICKPFLCIQLVVNAHILYNLSVSPENKLSSREFKLKLARALCVDLTDSLINSSGQAPRPVVTPTTKVSKTSNPVAKESPNTDVLGLPKAVWEAAVLHPKKDLTDVEMAEVAQVMAAAKSQAAHLEVPRKTRVLCWACRFLVPNDSALRIMKAADVSPTGRKWRDGVGKTCARCFSCDIALCRQCFFAFHSVRYEPYAEELRT